MNTYSQSEITKQYQGAPDPVQWTAIIPAAGRGSRLGYDKPKIMYPVAGRPILDWLIDLLEPRCSKLIFVLSPSGAPEIEPLLKKRLAGRYEIAIQEEPKGMADAIYKAVPQIATPYTLIIWGDQVAIRPTTLLSVMKAQQFNPRTRMTLPIVERDNPYVHYATDKEGRFTHVLERREGAAMPDVGQSDCGLFAFNTKQLQMIFDLEIKQGITYSQGTKEWNFLPMLPKFDEGNESIIGIRLDSLEETIGVNDKNDVAQLEAYLTQFTNNGKSK